MKRRSLESNTNMRIADSTYSVSDDHESLDVYHDQAPQA
jgi:hypothetical protein